ncbi:unnamed protein product [Closterium sp. Yama58-4]|nr:unnamed protein product [Closterium sp. Yama58-4]
MKTRDVVSLQRLIVGALLSLLVCAAAAQPTKATLIKELQDMRLAMTHFKYLGRYTLVATAINEILPKLDSFPEDADLSVLGQKTILIPQNAALGSAGVGALVQTGGTPNPDQIVKFATMALLHVLDGAFTGSACALGQSNNALSWSQIVNPGIHRGTFFIVHGYPQNPILRRSFPRVSFPLTPVRSPSRIAMSPRPFILCAFLALLVCVAEAEVTKSALISELKNARRSISQLKYLGQYSLVATAIDQALPKLDDIPDDEDLSQVDQKTVLVPQNAALGPAGLGTLIKTGAAPSAKQSIKFEKMGLINVLDGYFTLGELKKCSSVPTMLDGRRLKKYSVPLLMRKGTAVALGQSGNALSWSQIVNPGIYKGRFFILHGVDALQQGGYAISFKEKQQQLKTLKAQGRCSAHPKLFRTWLWESAFQEGSLAWVPQPGKYILMDCQRSQPHEVERFYDRRTFLHLPHLHRCYGHRSAIPLQQLREEVRGAAVNGGSRSAAAPGRGKGEAGGSGSEEVESSAGKSVSEAPQEIEEAGSEEEEGALMVQQVLCPYEACYMQPWTNKPSVLPELEGVVYHNMTWTALNMPLSQIFSLPDLRSLGSSLLPSADVVLFGDSYQWNLQGNISKSVGLPFGSSGGGGGGESKGGECANRLAVQPHPAVLEAALGFVQQVIWKSPDVALPEGITAAADASAMPFTAAVAAAGPSKSSAAEAGATQQQGSVSDEMMGSGGEQRQPQRYLAVHWRRGDLLLLYQKVLAFLTAENAGRCIAERMVRSGNISTVFLATDADEQEVRQLERVIRGLLPGVEIVQLPEELTGQAWAKVLEPVRFQNQALLRAMLDKAVCALADVFMGTPRSSFSTDIERLRTGFRISTCEDEYICESMLG